MYLVLSGEGPSDLGTSQPGPIAWLLDIYIAQRIGYSLLDTRGSFIFVSEGELAKIAKSLRTPLRGKRADSSYLANETRFYYKNARALGHWIGQQKFDAPVLALLFRDADGTASSGRGEWITKRRSMVAGFQQERCSGGVPVVPNPKSEAWLLCALKQAYIGCHKIELEASGNDRSPKNLKDQLNDVLMERYSKTSDRDFVSSLIRDGTIEFARLSMPSALLVKDGLDAAIDSILSNG